MSFTEKLRTSILSYSFSGKLTRLNLNDISVEERLHQTSLEKDQLILEKKIKKEKKVDTILEEDIPYKIPDHWKWLRLGTVLQTMLVPQRDKPKKFDGTIPWCRIEDLEGCLLNGSKSNQLVSQDTIEKMNLKVFPVGTVISANSASIGAKAINTVPCCTNQTFIGLVCSPSIYNWYLYWYLELIKPQLMKMATGTTIGYISQVKYANIMIPIPPIEEQQRIVNRVDELMAKVDELEKIEKELDQLESGFSEKLKLSIIECAMTGGLTSHKPLGKPQDDLPLIPVDWKYITVKEICQSISGKTPDPKNSTYWNGNFVWVTPVDMDYKNEYVLESQKKITESAVIDCRPKLVKQNDILLSRRAPIGYVQIAGKDLYISDGCVGLHINDKDKIDPRFLHKALLYRMPDIINRASGVTFKGTSAKKILATTIPLPPLEEQKQIVKRIDDLMVKIGDLEKTEQELNQIYN